MKTNNRVFVAAWDYPPIISGESVVCKRTLEYSRFDYDVCCGPISDSGNNHVRLLPIKGNKYLCWPFAVLRCFMHQNKTEHYQLMMSRVMPPNGHLAGWLIKRICPRIKWVAYFSDPIWNSPFLKVSIRKSKDQSPNWFLMKIYGFPAKWAVRQSDLLVFNNEYLARYILGNQYDQYKKKVVIAPYGHEGIHPRPSLKREDERCYLTHVGQLYGNRTLSPLINGLTILKHRNPELFKRIIIRQIGFISQEEISRIQQSEVLDAFQLLGQVSYKRSIEEMYQTDYLMTIDPVFDDPRKDIYIPGKIYDYMSTGKPILCIAAEKSITAWVATKAGFLQCLPNDENIYNMLIALLEKKRDGLDFDYSKKNYADFHCKYGVELLDCSMSKLIE